MAKKILCVIRTSTVRQEIESQKNDMIGFLREKGYNENEIEWLETAGASARSVNDLYLSMLETIKSTILNSSTIKAAAFWHLNRLGRWETYIVNMKDWFINNHIQVFVKTPNLTLLNEDGTLDNGANIAWGVFAAMVSYDTMEMMEKLKRGKDAAKAKGKFTGGKVLFGFKVNEDGYLVVHESDMELVRLVFSEYSTGNYSYYKLQAELESRGLNYTVRHMYLTLNNPIYKEYVGEELWNKCQDVKKNKDWGLDSKESKYCRLGLKLIKCAHCGKTYISDTNHYICINKKQGKRYGTVCKESTSIKIDVMDTILWDFASKIHMSYLVSMDKNSIEDLKADIFICHQKMTKAYSDLDKINNKLENAKNLFLDADITKDEYSKRKAQASAEAENIESIIKSLKSQIRASEDKIQALENPDMEAQFKLMATVGDITKETEMREIVRKHIKEVTIGNIEFNNRKCTLITVNDNYGKTYKVIYDHNANKREKGFLQKLYLIKSDDNIVRYTYTKSHSDIAKKVLK